MLYNAFIHDMVRIYKVLPGKFRFRLIGIFISQFLYALFETSTILVISFFAMSLAAANAAQNNAIVQILFSMSPTLKELASEPRTFVMFSCSLVMFFIILKNIVSFWSVKKTTRFAEAVSFYISEETLQRYLNKNYFWHISPDSGSILQRMNNRESLTNLLTNLLSLYSYTICCLTLFTSLMIAEPKLTLIVMLSFGITCASIYLGVRRRVDRYGKEVLESVNSMNKGMVGITRGIREILIYRQQPVFFKAISNAIRKGMPGRAFLAISGQAPAWLLESAGFATICAVTIFLLMQGTPMPAIVKAASMLLLTSWRILPAVNRVVACAINIRGVRPLAMNCLELLETFIRETSSSLPEPDPDFKFRKTLGLQNASFRYPTSTNDNVADVSLTIHKGASIGLIGPSGAGKSTLALLLSGLVSPRSGCFLIDDQVLNPSSLAAYTQRVGYVPQDPLLIAGSLADNVAFSSWGKDYDRERVKEACQKAGMDFVLTHPRGIDLAIGEGGGGLSGGQAQRVAIARALFTSPEVIIFDEATSALDQASENIIKHTIDELKGKITTIIIAHRLTTVEDCDFLVWLENGRVRKTDKPSQILPQYMATMT